VDKIFNLQEGRIISCCSWELYVSFVLS